MLIYWSFRSDQIECWCKESKNIITLGGGTGYGDHKDHFKGRVAIPVDIRRKLGVKMGG